METNHVACRSNITKRCTGVAAGGFSVFRASTGRNPVNAVVLLPIGDNTMKLMTQTEKAPGVLEMPTDLRLVPPATGFDPVTEICTHEVHGAYGSCYDCNCRKFQKAGGRDEWTCECGHAFQRHQH